MIDVGYHGRAVLLALRLEARERRGRPLLPGRRTGRGASRLSPRDAEQSVLASRRAVSRICRLNTCLTRSIVLFQLLERRFPVELVLGFRPGREGVEGHAWVTVDGVPLGETEAGLEGFVPVAADQRAGARPEAVFRSS